MTESAINIAPPRHRHAWLRRLRTWHTYIGAVAAIFLVVAAGTGIVLNYKKPIFGALGLEPAKSEPAVRPTGDTKLTVADAATHWPVTVTRALAAARDRWGDAALDAVELRTERGALLCKIKKKGGDELWLCAQTGTLTTKRKYEKLSLPGPDGQRTAAFDWGKLLIDLHTGKIFGEPGKVVVTVMSGGLIFLSLSGLFIWLRPQMIRARKASGDGSLPDRALGRGAG